MKFWLLLQAFCVSVGWASDDLLNILEGDQPVSSAQVSSSYRTPLRKLVPSPNAEQNIFFQFLDAVQEEKALYQWPEAFEGTHFAKSANGKGLYAYLLLKNGLPVVALETLLSIAEPKELDPVLAKEFAAAAPPTHPAWGIVQVPKWDPVWTTHFGESTEIRVRGRDVYGTDQVDFLKSILAKTRPGSEERALVIWQLVLALAPKDSGESAKVLSHLMKAENNPVSADLMNMTAARLLYEKGYLDAAINYYKKVPKSSEYWFEAQEEVGWAYLRKGEPNAALSVARTITVPFFIPLAGPESSFMKSLGQLKVCDYPGVMSTLRDFQQQFRPRVARLNEIAQGGTSEAATSALELLKKKKLNITDLKGEARNAPRFMGRDRALKNLAQVWAQLEIESGKAGELYSRSLAGGTAKVGFTAHFEQLKKNIDQRVQTAKASALNRVKMLAQEETDEIATILRKLHIVEAEVIQQTSLAERVVKDSKSSMALNKVSGVKVASNQLQFPVTTDREKELWFDELAHYEYDVKNACQAKKSSAKN